MDGLREIHFGDRSLSLSHLYKNDSRLCMPPMAAALLAVVVVVVLLVVDETLWWELSIPRGDDEPSTSKLDKKKQIY